MLKSQKKKNSYVQENTATDSVEHLLRDRIPWLLLGLGGGLLTVIIISKFEHYMLIYAYFRLLSDAVGSQTETIYIRAIAKTKVHFLNYVLKESLVGLALGVLFGLCLGVFAAYWVDSVSIAFTVGLATLINLTLAPILAVVIPSLIRRQHSDPALGAGPVATIIQDLLSLLVFFFITRYFI
jgi:magnesium transporter